MEKNDKDKNIDETKIYKVKNNSKKSKSVKKDKKGKGEKKKHPKLKKTIIIIFIILVILALAGIGAFAAIFFSDSWALTKEDLVISESNTTIYDSKKKKLTELSGDESRRIIPFDKMGKYTADAFVAIEDERFDSHSGVDILRTGRAAIEFILNGGESSFGGSTITQQLVKNLMDDDDDEGIAGVERKIREMSRAVQIEQMLSKQQILETYLNLIYMGGGSHTNVYGVEMGAQYYFAKSAKDLTLVESAFLAGINHIPNAYDPYGEEDNTELIKNRTKTVLSQMKKLGKINDEEYEKAVEKANKGFKFKQGNISSNVEMSFHTAAAIDQVIRELAKSKEIDYGVAKTILYSGGYKLYTTQDSKIQKKMEKEMKKDDYVTTTEDEKGNEYKAQAGMVIIDYKTGEVVGTVGALGDDSHAQNLNRAVNDISRQPGSSIKPLVVIAPGLEEKVITAATVYDDSKTNFGNDSPNNAGGYYKGLCTVREAIEVSSNVVNAKILTNIGFNTGVKYAKEFGLSNYGQDDAVLSLALGGTRAGTSPLQMAAAYGAIANDGEYIEPTFYKKLVDSNGKTILEPKQETRRVMSESNAYILKNILQEPVYGSEGTAWRCSISGMDVAAKTGTAEGGKDKWLCGFTPYYSAAVWYGYDMELPVYYSSAAAIIWSSVMEDVHEDLESASFKRPNNIVTAKICKKSGKLATDKCKSTYTEVFVSGTVPSYCEGHVELEICKDSGKIATEYCPNKVKKTYTARPEKEVNAKWNTSGSSKYNIPEEKCDKHTEKNSTIIVQNVVGKTEAIATNLLKELNVKVVYEEDLSKAEGIVLRQSVAAGEKIKKGTAITIVVNKYKTVPEDPNSNTQPGDNNEIIGGNNEIEGNNEQGEGGTAGGNNEIGGNSENIVNNVVP